MRSPFILAQLSTTLRRDRHAAIGRQMKT